jgi:hypothetical protein
VGWREKYFDASREGLRARNPGVTPAATASWCADAVIPRLAEHIMRLTTICCKSLAALLLLAGMQAANANALDDYRVAFAHAIYAATPAWVHNRNPQPLLRAVVVLRLHMGADHRM